MSFYTTRFWENIARLCWRLFVCCRFKILENHYVGVFITFNWSPPCQISHQHPKIVKNTFCLQHRCNLLSWGSKYTVWIILCVALYIQLLAVVIQQWWPYLYNQIWFNQFVNMFQSIMKIDKLKFISNKKI